MWDFVIVGNLTDKEWDILKSYFVVNNLQFDYAPGKLKFFADTAMNFMETLSGLLTFGHQHGIPNHYIFTVCGEENDKNVISIHDTWDG